MAAIFKYFYVTAFALLIFCCKEDLSENRNHRDESPAPIKTSQKFTDYWYSGRAELNRYSLEQSRYGELHKGDAVLIFVTEDFLKDRQVKYEGGETDEEKLSVLKLNFTRKFYTGIYPYSLMSSIFTSIAQNPSTLKISNSNQEWCGQTFTQLNLRDNSYVAKQFSYFMNEGDKTIEMDDAILEDGLWNLIRLNPELLPTGNIELLPSIQYLRLIHRDMKIESATASIREAGIDSVSKRTLQRYTVKYEDFNRTLSIAYETEFPHSIISWSETGDAGFGKTGSLTTTALRTHLLNEPYWRQNSVSDSTMRKKLGL